MEKTMLETNINNLDPMDKNPVLGVHVRRRNIIAKLQRLEQRALRVEVRRFLQRDVEYSALQVRLKEVKHRVHVLRRCADITCPNYGFVLHCLNA